MRPFRRRWPSANANVLDEEATAEATAEQVGRLTLVLQPQPERWFEAVLVTEDAPSMDVWHETLAEFRRMLLETGAFRNVHTARLGFGAAASAAAANGQRDGVAGLEPTLHSSAGGHISPAGLASTRVRRLIFFATHGISPRWLDGSLAAVLDAWARTASVVILHLLPPRLWQHTALGEPRGLVRATTPGSPSARLKTHPFPWDLSLDDEGPIVALPVIPLEPGATFNWAQMEMARGRRAPAVLVPTTAAPRVEAPAPAAAAGCEELVKQFRAFGSPLAFRLAVYLSPGPFTLPVARTIQAARFGAEAQQSQLAEVMLSGLVRRLTPLDETAHPDWVQYGVEPEARRLLMHSLREEDAQDVAAILQRHVNRFIEDAYGKPADFRALVRDPEGKFDLPAWAQPFADLGTALIGLAASGARGLGPAFEPETALEPLRDWLFAGLPVKPVDYQAVFLDLTVNELVKSEQRQRLVVLGVTAAQPLPSALWRKLVDEHDLAPLDAIGGIAVDAAGALTVAPRLAEALLRYAGTDAAPALHSRVFGL